MSGGAFEPADSDYERRVRESFARQGVMAFIGAEITEVRPGGCEIRLPYRAELTQQDGFLHAGVVSTIVDSAGGYAGFSLMPAGAGVLTVEFKLNLLAPADGELLVARGEVVRAGRTLVVTRGDVSVHKSGRERLCATMLQTLMTMHGKGDGKD